MRKGFALKQKLLHFTLDLKAVRMINVLLVTLIRSEYKKAQGIDKWLGLFVDFV